MDVLNFIFSLFESGGTEINPSTGLPLIDGTTVDVEGHEFGCGTDTLFDSSSGFNTGGDGWI